MRSTKRVGLDDVVAKFEDWRRNRRTRAIPDDLWDAAIGLLDAYSANEVCRALGLNQSRFKQARDARGAVRRGRAAARREVPRTSRKAGGFVELLPLRLGPGGVALSGDGTRALGERMHATEGWRLTLEGATGTLSLVTRGSGPPPAPVPGRDLVEALCRFVFGAVMAGPRS